MVTALALHPAARRKLLATLPPALPDETVLRPIGGGGPANLIASADEQSFIDAILHDLGRSDWRQAIAARRGLRRGSDGVLELSQPVHQRFHLVLVEAFCRQPGSPRLDPAKLDGMGLVVRRRTGAAQQGWMLDGAAKVGWRNLAQQDLDPDPARRHWLPPTAHGHIGALVLARRMPQNLAEEIMPLFAAPSDLCDKLGRTVLFGLVPVTSPDRVEAAEPAPDYAALPPDEAQGLRDHLSEYLKARPRLSMPRAGQALDPDWNPLALASSNNSDDLRLNAFGLFLQQLIAELGAFEGGSAARDLLTSLNRIALPMARDNLGRVTRTLPAGTFVTAAAPILVAGDPNHGASGFNPLTMPLEWPAIDAALGAELTRRAIACIGERFFTVSPGSPKYDGDARLYTARPFIRVKGHDGCPSRLVWGDYSEPFRILPWWDGDGPATKIPLPDPRNFRRMKTNVAIEVPASLANLINGDAKKLKDGEGSTGGLDIMWICSLSIPIITICAFIVLSIFLVLFDLIFRWMAFIKICIPIPKSK